MPSTTLNYTTQVGQEFAADVGEEMNYRDANGARRSATEAECKEWIKGECQRLMMKYRRRAHEAAFSTTPPEFT